MDNNQRLHAIVSGRVQGVSFRYYTAQTARSLGLRGWVRNKVNGTVEVTTEGNRELLERLLKFLYEGPTSAYVTGVESQWLEASDEFENFQILY